MILTDVNILIYAYDINFKHHYEIKTWFEEKLASTDSIYLSWQSVSGFLRITTNPRLFQNPMLGEKAREKVNQWLSRPNVSILLQTEKHWTIFERLLVETKIVGPKTMDAHLAALAIEHGVTLATTDRDFLAFKGLRVLNPLDL
jgi:uncharacterized protein